MNKPKSFTMVPIKRTDVFQTVIERITLLIEQNLSPGDRLPSERELAESLGVSRTSIRQALKVLESMRKVETKIGSGTYVINHSSNDTTDAVLGFSDVEISKDFLRKLIKARVAIERAVFEECFDKMNATHLQDLRQLLHENTQELKTEGNNEGETIDLSFESKIAEIGKNEILIALQQQIHQLWIISWRKYGYVPEENMVLHKEHLEILDAIEQGNKQRTIELIEDHVYKNID